MQRGADRLPAGGLLGEPADLHLAPLRQQQRARDRRRGHHQHVGPLALGAEQQPLIDAEPVLLVDHRQRQVAILHALLEQRMGADHDAGCCRLASPAQHVARGRALHRAGQQRHRHRAELRQRARDAAAPAPRSAPSARPAPRPRPRAAWPAAATSVLPEPTSPCSSRSMRRGAARSASISAMALQLATAVGAMAEPGQRLAAQRAVAGRARGRAARARAAADQATRDLVRQQLVIGQPAARLLGAGQAQRGACSAAQRLGEAGPALAPQQGRRRAIRAARAAASSACAMAAAHLARPQAGGQRPDRLDRRDSSASCSAGTTWSGCGMVSRSPNGSSLPETSSCAPDRHLAPALRAEEHQLGEAGAVGDHHPPGLARLAGRLVAHHLDRQRRDLARPRASRMVGRSRRSRIALGQVEQQVEHPLAAGARLPAAPASGGPDAAQRGQRARTADARGSCCTG